MSPRRIHHQRTLVVHALRRLLLRLRLLLLLLQLLKLQLRAAWCKW